MICDFFFFGGATISSWSKAAKHGMAWQAGPRSFLDGDVSRCPLHGCASRDTSLGVLGPCNSCVQLHLWPRHCIAMALKATANAPQTLVVAKYKRAKQLLLFSRRYLHAILLRTHVRAHTVREAILGVLPRRATPTSQRLQLDSHRLLDVHLPSCFQLRVFCIHNSVYRVQVSSQALCCSRPY